MNSNDLITAEYFTHLFVRNYSIDIDDCSNVGEYEYLC